MNVPVHMETRMIRVNGKLYGPYLRKRPDQASETERIREWRRRTGNWPNLKPGPKQRARDTVRAAVFSGKIKKPETCSLCNQPTTKKHLHGHHDDYSKMLDVKWLCRTCHNKVHEFNGSTRAEFE